MLGRLGRPCPDLSIHSLQLLACRACHHNSPPTCPLGSKKNAHIPPTCLLPPPLFGSPHAQARQALGVGPDAFLPSTLEAQEQTLKELDVFAPNLRDMVKAARTFADDTHSRWGCWGNAAWLPAVLLTGVAHAAPCMVQMLWGPFGLAGCCMQANARVQDAPRLEKLELCCSAAVAVSAMRMGPADAGIASCVEPCLCHGGVLL